jgi:hypothetical protein
LALGITEWQTIGAQTQDQVALGERLLSGIPVEDLRKRKKHSKLALRAMREIEGQNRGGSFLWWLLGAGLINALVILLMRASF